MSSIASMGDMLGAVKGAVVNVVVRHVKKMVPAYACRERDDIFNDATEPGRTLPFARPGIGPDDIAFLQYTGGTTGVAKGAMLLHRNLVANVLQVEAWDEPMVAVPPRGRPHRSSSPRCRSITSSRSPRVSCSACATAASAC